MDTSWWLAFSTNYYICVEMRSRKFKGKVAKWRKAQVARFQALSFIIGVF